ncbi:hypothetical protein [Rathayibacter iranicus]|uniref:hypothetical protein n=1 Tax=Rathayibacter iranicus TaxID=59737 RepID=UPI000FDB6481|nr:hypothetical protein [Rathayibacter iranicus]MWV32124.1 hypothetical protein [Rathayibacter iranicus NCPPB 2253 = VKM Ac-1602]
MTRLGKRAAPRTRPNRRLLLAGGAVLAALLILGGVLVALLPPRPAPTTTVAEVPVGFSCARVPEGLTLGVVVSLSSAPGEGAEWKDAANGAVVAARRFAMGGCAVRLIAVDDHGTADGARAAVEELASQQVSGLVIATDGSHAAAAVDAARASGIAALLPYGGDAMSAGEGAWPTAPDAARIDAALVEASGPGSRTLLVDAGGTAPQGVAPEATLVFAPGGSTADLVDAARPHLGGEHPVDRVLVSGPAETQATAVAALQAAGTATPILLTPDAQSPHFASTLVDAGGTLSGDLTTAGVDSGDAVALRGDEAGRAMSAYLAALRVAADDSAQTALLGDRPFREVSAVADTPSHDAVVALVRAAAAAGRRDPSAVTAALSGSVVGPAEGLAGPSLDFSAPTALDAPVVPLHATPQDLGLRPTTVPLLWFAGQPQP